MATGKDALIGLDATAMEWTLRAHEVPLAEQPAAWATIELLHDIACHGSDHYSAICVDHVLGGDELFDLSCWKCRNYMREFLTEPASGAS